MIALEIFKLESETDPVSKLEVGVYNFGRGSLLKCDDRRVSRNHGIITITNDGASITSTHQNPCFFQLAASKTITILPKDLAVNINDGDKFALLADQFWFKIKILKRSLEELPNETNTHNVLEEQDLPTNGEQNVTDIVDNNNEDKLNNQMKRNCEEESSVQVKKIKLESNDLETDSDRNSNVTIKEVASKKKKPVNSQELSARHAELKAMLFSSDDEENKTVDDVVQQLSPAVPLEGDANNLNGSTDTNITECDPLSSDQNLAADEPNLAPNDQNLATNDQNKAGPSGTRPWRDYCLYGLECYRKSGEHLAEFSHPGDSDYESDANDERPLCAYGAACYRVNKDHRKAYRHPHHTRNVKDPLKKRTNKRNGNIAPVLQKRKTKQTYKDESSEDEYDMDDPFMADSGSSEFEVESGSTDDSDSDVSDGAEEETKRLLKEAKRFTRSKKKKKDKD